MRVVFWNPQERVDVPDMAAASFLVLGEFRRSVRELMLGGEENRLLRGFEVEASAVPDALVTVRLNDSGTLSAAVGSENVGSHINYGQLMGGEDDNQNNEGNAQQTLDFSAQPAATYTVQMRFTYAEGATDNRAFWDPSTDSEYIDNVSTRYLPGFELRLSGAASAEWIDLAEVVWNGATISPGDITDLRTFAMEGTTPFQQTTQTGTGGMPDFDRGAGRADTAIGLNAMWPVLRALGRQVQDLKGPDNSGNWNWWNRPYSPLDPDGSLTAGHTKHLRSVDTVTYTVGDGSAYVGDFNGASGLDDALTHLASITDANRPERVEIVLYGNSYTISGQKAIAPRTAREMTVVIRGGPKYALPAAGTFQRPLVTIDGDSLSPGEFGIVTQNGSALEVYNINFSYTGDTTGGRNVLGASGGLVAEDCIITHGVSGEGPDVGSGFAIFTSRADRSRITRCRIRGRLRLYNQEPLPGPDAEETGIIEHCRIDAAQIQLHAASVAGGELDHVNRFVIRDCHIFGRGAAVGGDIYTGSVATIDARAAFYLSVERCLIGHNVNENGIDGREYATSRPFHWRIVDCNIAATSSFGTPHTAGAGTGGADGTGWGINLDSSNGSPTLSHMVRGCRFSGDSIDAGGIRLHHVEAPFVSDCEWTFNENGAGGSDTYTALLVDSDSANFASRGKFRGLTIHNWSSGSRTRGIRLTNVDDVVIADCTLRGDDFSGSDISGRTNDDCAIRLEDVEYIRILGCDIQSWNHTQTTSAGIIAVASSEASQVTISACTFLNNGNYAIDWAGSAGAFNAGPIIKGCQIIGGGNSNNLGIHLTSAATNFNVASCNIRLNTGAGFDAIFTGPTQNPAGTVVACRSNGDFRKTGTNLMKGYLPDDNFLTLNQQLNNFNAYT